MLVNRPEEQIDEYVVQALEVVSSEERYRTVQLSPELVADVCELAQALGQGDYLTKPARLVLSSDHIFVYYAQDYLSARTSQTLETTEVQDLDFTEVRRAFEAKLRSSGEVLHQLVVETVTLVTTRIEVRRSLTEIVDAILQDDFDIRPGKPQEQILELDNQPASPPPAAGPPPPAPPGPPPPAAGPPPRVPRAGRRRRGPRRKGGAPAGLALPFDPCAAGSVNIRSNPVITGLLGRVQPRPETVQAVANLSYLVAVGHDMGLASAYSKLIEHWVNGDWRFNASKLNSHLYCVHRERPFLPPDDFAKLTASVLGITLKELPPGSSVNSAYPKLFDQLIDAFIQFNEDDRVRRRGTNPALATIAVARDNLVANLEANVTGIAIMQIRELSGRLRQALAVFNHPEVIRQVACGQHDHLSAIANLNGGGQPMLGSLLALHDTAIARNDIYDWIAPFSQKQFTAAQRFDRALRAAVTIRATARWFTTRAGAEGTVTPFPSGKAALQAASR